MSHRMRAQAYLAEGFALAMGLCAALWTGIGETSNPELAVEDLPQDISGCAAQDCAAGAALNINWLGKTQQGQLFLIVGGDCEAANCRSWLVEKSARVRVLLPMQGRFKLERDGGEYPPVHVKRALSEAELDYRRYEWQAGSYVETLSERRYVVDGVECGNAKDCEALAQSAMQVGQAAFALRILERVHKRPWI